MEFRGEVYVVRVQDSAENEVDGFKHSLQFGRVVGVYAFPLTHRGIRDHLPALTSEGKRTPWNSAL